MRGTSRMLICNSYLTRQIVIIKQFPWEPLTKWHLEGSASKILKSVVIHYICQSAQSLSIKLWWTQNSGVKEAEWCFNMWPPTQSWNAGWILSRINFSNAVKFSSFTISSISSLLGRGHEILLMMTMTVFINYIYSPQTRLICMSRYNNND